MANDDEWAQQSIDDAKAQQSGITDAVGGILSERLSTKLAAGALTKKDLATLAKELLFVSPQELSEAKEV